MLTQERYLTATMVRGILLATQSSTDRGMLEQSFSIVEEKLKEQKHKLVDIDAAKVLGAMYDADTPVLRGIRDSVVLMQKPRHKYVEWFCDMMESKQPLKELATEMLDFIANQITTNAKYKIPIY